MYIYFFPRRMSGLKCFYFGEEAVPPVRHDKMKKKKEFARVPREKYDRLTQEVTFKKPHVSCGFSPVYYIHRGAEYIDTRAKRKKTKGGREGKARGRRRVVPQRRFTIIAVGARGEIEKSGLDRHATLLVLFCSCRHV